MSALELGVAHAEEPLRVAVFPTASSDPRQARLASAIDAWLILADLSESQDSAGGHAPGARLPATEFAFGCALDDARMPDYRAAPGRVEALIAAVGGG